MPEPPVTTVMTRTVFTASLDTPFQELVATMTERHLAALPVIDTTARPVGIVSDVDTLAKLEYHCGADHPPVLAGRRARTRWHKAIAYTVRGLMTSPAPTIPADTPISVAASQLADPRPRVLCVVDNTGRLIGVLTRRDLLRIYLRGDHAIETDIQTQLAATIHNHHQITVQVTNGVATLTGILTWHSTADHAHQIARSIPGVITTSNNLTYHVDDLAYTGL